MNIIITAPKHLGKSTLIAKLLKLLPGSVSGLITEFIDRECPDRSLILRSVGGDRRETAAVWKGGQLQVNRHVFDEFAPSLIDRDSDFVVIDELGKFENDCENLRAAVTAAFDSPCHVLASIRLDALGWMQELKGRDDVLLIELDEANRGDLPGLILRELGLE